MHGRGSSDSKAGAAIFAHVAARLHQAASRWHGSVVLLFDVDEHTGAFGGARAYFEGPGAPSRVDGVMIGYPGLNHLIIGGRGVLRARVQVHGIAGHSGGNKTTPSAVTKAVALIQELHSAGLPGPAGPAFPLPAKLTVTAVSGGEGYSTVPDLCTFNVDVRLTPAFDATAATDLLESLAASADTAWPGTQPTQVQITTRWPAFALPGDSPLRGALLSATAAAGLRTTAKSPGRPTSATTSPGSASRPPPGSASTTTACMAPTNGSGWLRSRRSRPSTTRLSSPCCTPPDQGRDS